MLLKTVDYNHDDSPEIFTKSLADTGFGIVKNHPVDVELINRVYDLWNDYFSWPDEKQQAFLFNKDTHEGHITVDVSENAKGNPIKDLKEFYHFYDWGRCPENLKQDTQKLYLQMVELAKELLVWIERYTPKTISENLSQPLTQMIEKSPNTLLRIIHYPGLTGDEPEGAIRAAAHEDINLITLLPAATAEGLQVLEKNGNWLDVPCEPNTIIVNIGDMLHECTDGYFHATKHRVINPTGEKAKQPRLSMPLFLHPRDEVVLSKRHTRKSYCTERFKEIGLA